MSNEKDNDGMTRADEARRLIGKAIIDGLITPVGGLAVVEDYDQTQGGYWQNTGTHKQQSGDYHQFVIAKIE